MLWKSIQYTKSTVAKTFPKAQQYIEHFEQLQKKMGEQKKIIEELERQNELAQRAKVKTISDSVKEVLSKITKQQYESSALRGIKKELVEHRNQLQKKMQQSNVKWEQPRKTILAIRQQVQEEFLASFVTLDMRLQEILTHNIEDQQLNEGCALTHRLLLSILQKHGIEFYDAEVGTPFNPDHHETVDEVKEGGVISEVRSRGWKIGDRVVKKPVVRM